MKRTFFALTLLITSFITQAQIVNPTKWEFSSTQNGREVDLIFTAKIDQGWHLYDTYLPEGGPIATSFVYEDSTLFDYVYVLLCISNNHRVNDFLFCNIKHY